MDTLMEVGAVIKDYQTLIAALIALAAAYFTIKEMRKQATLDKKRRADAAIAALPTYLSDLTKYAEQCVLEASSCKIQIARYDGTPPKLGPKPKMPNLNDGVINKLAEAASVAGSPFSPGLTELIHWYQIQNSRLESMIERFEKPKIGNLSRGPSPIEADDRINDAVKLHLKADEFYEPARAEARFRDQFSKEKIAQRRERILGPGG